MNLFDTITAISTPIGEGGISVIRISGIDAFPITEKIFFKDINRNKKINISELSSHTIHFGFIFDDENLTDEVLISIFKNPNSYTGEDVIEISSHGGVLISRKIISTILKNGARHSEPGEFTKRAFLNKRIDLSQAEAVADLIKSRTDIAHSSSLKQLEGALSGFIHKIRQEIIDATSLVELELDFAEEHVEFVKKNELKEKISVIISELEKIVDSYISGKVIREGINLVITGKPNSGKSSLFNFLLKSERAIVSETSGTTRDYLSENLIIDGILFNLIDTAGLRTAEDHVESEGIKRSFEKIGEADLILYLIDSSNKINVIKEDINYYNNNFSTQKSIPLFSKYDVANELIEKNNFKNILDISLYNDASIEELKKRMVSNVSRVDFSKSKDNLILTNLRHKICLQNVITSLKESTSSIDKNLSGEFISVDLRNALNFLGEITGEVTNEEILNNIFKNFCIGK
jgi:tRNA modification GTPase